MNPASRQMIMESLREAMSREELHTRGAAKALNLNPCYVSMALNPKSWDSIGKTAWIRLTNWFYTREPITSFQIPEGEEIWKPKEKDPAARITEPEVPKKYKKEKREKLLIDTSQPGEEGFIVPAVEESTVSLQFYNQEAEKWLKTQISYDNEIEKLMDHIVYLKSHTTAPSSNPAHIPANLDLNLNIEITINGKKISQLL